MRLSYRWVDKKTFDVVYKTIDKKVFDLGNYFADITPTLTARESKGRTRAFDAAPQLCLVAYDGDKPVGYSQSLINHSGDLFMRLSGVLKSYRRKGIYDAMLKRVVARAKKEGCVRIISNHLATNNPIIIAKLRADFVIIGLQQSPDAGLLVQLVHHTNPAVDKLYRFRVGAAKLDKKLAKRLKTNPLR
jgi:GNAT superfamily N-acetyltransferase